MIKVRRYISFLTLQIRLYKKMLGFLFIALAVSQLGIIIWKLLSVKKLSVNYYIRNIPYFYNEILDQNHLGTIFLVGIVLVGAAILYGYAQIDREFYHIPIRFSEQVVLQFIFLCIVLFSLWMYELFILIIGAGLYRAILPSNMLEPDMIVNTWAQSSFLRRCYPITNLPRMIDVIVLIITLAFGLACQWKDQLRRHNSLINMIISVLSILYYRVSKVMFGNQYSLVPACVGFIATMVTFEVITSWYYRREERSR